MAFILNTSHPKYASLKTLIVVDDTNTIVDLKGGQTLSPNANVTFGSGTYGRHFNTLISGTDAQGVAMSPGILTKGVATNAGTTIVIVNGIASRSARGGVFGTNSAVALSVAPTGVTCLTVSASGTPTNSGTTNVVGTGAHMIAAGVSGNSGAGTGKVWVDGAVENSGTSVGNSSDSALAVYYGGSPTGGYGGIAGSTVMIAQYDTLWTDAEMASLWASVGANNTCALYSLPADTTAPNLTLPTGAATGNTTASASVSTDEGAGTAWVLTQLAATAAPEATAVKTGRSKSVTAVGVQTFTGATGLTPDALYKNYFVQVDAAPTPNTSAVVASASFRTTGAVTFSGPVPTRNSVMGVAASFNNSTFFASAFTLNYTLQAGTLPPGLTLNSTTGVVSGTPTAAGTYSGIVIRATDTNGNTADTNAYSSVVAASNAAPTFPGSISNITGTNGVAITPVNVSGQFSDTDTLTYSASPAGTAWPSGLVVNSSTGVISGTVATSTTTGLKVRATDTASQTVDSNAFSVAISAPVTSYVDLAGEQCDNELAGLLYTVPLTAVVFRRDDLSVSKQVITGLTTDASGNPPSRFAVALPVGTPYHCVFIRADDSTITGVVSDRVTAA